MRLGHPDGCCEGHGAVKFLVLDLFPHEGGLGLTIILKHPRRRHFDDVWRMRNVSHLPASGGSVEQLITAPVIGCWVGAKASV